MTDVSILPRRAVLVCLVAAPLCELAEQVLSPLTGSSTTADLQAIADHHGTFVASVLIGLLGTVLYVPAFTGLATACLRTSPIAARVGAALAVVSMLGFAGVRMGQALELEAVDQALDTHTAARLTDGLAGNAIGAPLLAMFLGGTVIGVVALAIASWRSGLPRPAVVLLVLFPFVDLGAKGHVGTVISHAVLLVALTWLAAALARSTPRPTEALVAA